MIYLNTPTKQKKKKVAPTETTVNEENQQNQQNEDVVQPPANLQQPQQIPEMQIAVAPIQNVPNVNPDQAIIPLEANIPLPNNDAHIMMPSNPTQNTVQMNQLRQAPVIFHEATFQNCNITLNMPQ